MKASAWHIIAGAPEKQVPPLEMTSERQIAFSTRHTSTVT
jgi:hypothetical protein